MPFCNKCGTEMPDGVGFCHSCGSPLGEIKEAETSSPEIEYQTVVRKKPVYGVVNLENLPKGHVIDDRYEIIEKLGQGGFGAVYRAYDTKMEIDKALKVLPEAVVSDLEAMEGLKAEATTMVRLNHPNIVRVYDFQDKGEIKYIDMEFVDGKNLTEVKMQAEAKKLSEKAVTGLGRKIAKGLAYAHSQNVIHRDIKPQNILVSKSGDVKIMDFGISETVKSSMSRIANSGSSGTLVYMSPEQIIGKDVGKEADIYSFAAMLYELLSGKPPFHKGAIEHQILNVQPTEIDGISKEMNTFLLKCLAKDYIGRYRNFEEVLDALDGKAPVSSKNTETYRRVGSAHQNAFQPYLKKAIIGGIGFLAIILVALFTLNFGDKENQSETKKTADDVSIQVEKPGLFSKKESEAGYNAAINSLDKNIRAMQKRLNDGTPQTGDSLKAINSLIVEKGKEEKKLVAFIKKEKAEHARLQTEKVEAFMKQLKSDIQDYKDVVNSEYGKTMKATAWKTLAEKYPKRSNGVETGDTRTLLYGFAVLKVKINPKDAKISLLNVKQQFRQGMNLQAGKYRLKVSKDGYFGKEVNISLKAGKTRQISVDLLQFGVLSVATNPEDAKISLLNSKRGFRQGMRLKAGEYRIKVFKEGYIGKEVDLTLKAGLSKEVSVDLVQYGRLYVNTNPKNARVKILNVKGTYSEGMRLVPGEYQVEVSASKCYSEKRSVQMKAGENKKVSINLEKGFKNSLGMTFVYIHPGSFEMGSSNGEYNEKPVRRVSLSKGFYMQTTEVTQGQWRSVMGNNPSQFSGCGSDCPVENVSWNDAKDFIRKLNGKEGTDKYRLPTEAEWEYACRAGSDTQYANGNSLDLMGWYKKNSGNKTHSVGQKKANAWGLYDMHGNVWEWCEDLHWFYPPGNVTDPVGSLTRSRRVLRGGGWNDIAWYCRSTTRHNWSPHGRGNTCGFRLVLSSGQ